MLGDSTLSNPEQTPEVLHFRYWLDLKFKEGITLKVSLNNKQPNIIKNYLPSERYVTFEITSMKAMPVANIEVNQEKKTIELRRYRFGTQKEYEVMVGKYKFVFTLDLQRDTRFISTKYANQLQDQDRHRYVESVTDLIRSEAEFMSKYEKDQELQLVKQADKLENQMQNEIWAEITAVKSVDWSLKKILIIFLLFLFLGYLLGSGDDQDEFVAPRKNRRNKKKVKKTKRN